MRTGRSIAGIFALVAMALSLTETVWASTCPPMADAPIIAEAEQPPTDTGADRHDHDPEQHRMPAGEDAPSCPFAPAIAPGCGAAASLPTHVAFSTPPSPEREVIPPATGSRPELLFGSSLFHPPRA